jgi:hypothetical protein
MDLMISPWNVKVVRPLNLSDEAIDLLSRTEYPECLTAIMGASLLVCSAESRTILFFSQSADKTNAVSQSL